MADWSEFEKKTRVSFKNKDLLKHAFVHRSYLNENRGVVSEHNERLEFLGDAVLELVATQHLFEKYPDKPEGDLTAYRAALVNTVSLAESAAELDMSSYLLLSKGEERDTGRARQYILANTFEAVIGALYLDQGYDAAKDFVSKYLLHKTEAIVAENLWQDAKSNLQERAQDKLSTTPHYTTLKEDGPDHDKHFTVGVFVGDKKLAEGIGASKQEAEQNAANVALETQGW